MKISLPLFAKIICAIICSKVTVIAKKLKSGILDKVMAAPDITDLNTEKYGILI